MKRRNLTSILAAAAMLLFILDGKTALSGAQTGIALCLHTVVPSLFPFFVLSGLLAGGSWKLLKPLGRIWQLPKGAEYLAIPAFLGGYPVGAGAVTEAWTAGRISREEAQRLLAFCSNAGPAFLFGMAASLFPKPWMSWALWAVHLGSAWMVARLLPPPGEAAPLPSRKQPDITEALSTAVRVMGQVCGWVILFRVAIAFLDKWVFWRFPAEIQVALTGLLELANGCFALSKIENLPLRFTLCAGMLAAGGLCVAMQTRSVTRGLSLKLYFWGKAMQMLWSLALCGCIFRGQWFLPITVLLYGSLLLTQKRKRGSNTAPLGV